MKASKKRGFTIIELVIVIAVIAILAAVLIPTFSNVIQKAKEANDTIMVKRINEALSTDAILRGEKHSTMTEALQSALDRGYDLTKIRSTAGNNKILWDSVSDCFVYLKDGEITYIPDSKDSAADTSKLYNYYRIVDNAAAVADSNYSTYMASTTESGAIVAKAGFDAGENTAITSVTYSSESSNNAVIRTNGSDLTVDAANGHVEHYGLAKTVNITAVSESTYIEHGTVAKMNVAEAAKNVVIKSTAVVVEIDNKSENLNSEGGFIAALTSGSKALKSGSIASGDEIYVGNYDQLQGLAYSSTMGYNLDGKTIKLTADINMTGKTWTPFGFRMDTGSSNHFTGTIDGQGHKIVGLSNGSYKGVESRNEWTAITGDDYGFIAYTAGDVVVKNITFEDVDINSDTAKTCGVVVGNTQDGNATTSLTLENIKVTGSVIAKDKAAGLVGYLKYVNNAKISNCTVDATISATATTGESFRAGGLLGYVSSTNVIVEKCSYKGNVTANSTDRGSWCGLLTAGCASNVVMDVKDCTFVGTAKTTTNTKDENLACKLGEQFIVGVLYYYKGEVVSLNAGTFTINGYSSETCPNPNITQK